MGRRAGHRRGCAVVTRYLADSSVWIGHLRGNPALTGRLAQAQATGRLVICEPVAMELLAGARGAQIAAVDALVNGIPGALVDPSLDFRRAAAIRRSVRAHGLTVRSLVDCLIAAVAERHDDLVVAHDDVDFERIAEATGLRQERWAA